MTIDKAASRRAALTAPIVAMISLMPSYSTAVEQQVPELARLAQYDVVWTTPSRDANGSMPIGNGEIGLNVWWQDSGDLQFFIASTEAWDEVGRLVKIGKVRVHLSPNPLAPGRPFKQTLSLADGTIGFVCGPPGDQTRLAVWVDADHPVIEVTAEGDRPVEATASIELWRTGRKQVDYSGGGYFGDPGFQHPQPAFVGPDTVLTRDAWPSSLSEPRIGWYHHNGKSDWYELTAKHQGLEACPGDDPLENRTFGAVITARGARRLDDLTLTSPAALEHRFAVHVLTRRPALSNEWLKAMDGSIRGVESIPFDRRREGHCRWWSDFWKRSWILVSSGGGDSADAGRSESALNGQNPAQETGQSEDPARAVTRGYILQRWMNACAGRGALPIKFNGSLFTVPFAQGWNGDPDYRRWGSGYWWQNTRLPYLSACTAGDFDLLQSLFRMYTGPHLRMAKYRNQHHLKIPGAFLNECAYFWGHAFNDCYGFNRPKDLPAGINESGWHRWEFTSGYELVFMMLDTYEHTLDEAFLKKTLLPFAQDILTFYDVTYQTDARGKAVVHPAQALETWWDCANPQPDIAGLTAVTERLLSLPQHFATPEQQSLWRRLRDKMPELPVQVIDGRPMLAPAARFADKRNVENPELYAVFPFRLVAVGRSNVALGIEALHHRLDRGSSGWRQDDLFMAYLGLADEARDSLAKRAANKDESSRFPAFWGPNYDWVPDQDHGGVLMKTLQSMILQTDGRKVILLPAWPSNWDADFKLHAPYRTTIQGRIRKSKLLDLKVVPTERAKDIVIMGQVPASQGQ